MSKTLRTLITAGLLMGGSALAYAAVPTAGVAPCGPGMHDGKRGEVRAAKRAAMLAKFDTNKNGQLEDAERQAAHKARAAERFAAMDLDKNGTISRDEFEKAAPMRMGGHRGRHGFGPRPGAAAPAGGTAAPTR